MGHPWIIHRIWSTHPSIHHRISDLHNHNRRINARKFVLNVLRRQCAIVCVWERHRERVCVYGTQSIRTWMSESAAFKQSCSYVKKNNQTGTNHSDTWVCVSECTCTYNFINIIAIMQDKDLFGGIIGKYSDCTDGTAANGIQKNDDCKIASNSSAPRPCKCEKE